MNVYGRLEQGAVLAMILLAATPVLAGDTPDSGLLSGLSANSRAVGLGFCAALTMTLSVMGAAHAVSRIGSAAMGAAAEKPELLTRSLLFVALAEGLAVLGFAIAMMLVQKI